MLDRFVCTGPLCSHLTYFEPKRHTCTCRHVRLTTTQISLRIRRSESSLSARKNFASLLSKVCLVKIRIRLHDLLSVLVRSQVF